MKHVEAKRSSAVPVTARVSPRVKGKLEALARRRHRSAGSIAAEAIEAYLKVDAWQVREIKKSMEQIRAGAPTIHHDKVAAWLDSWGTDHELPPPWPIK